MRPVPELPQPQYESLQLPPCQSKLQPLRAALLQQPPLQSPPPLLCAQLQPSSAMAAWREAGWAELVKPCKFQNDKVRATEPPSPRCCSSLLLLLHLRKTV